MNISYWEEMAAESSCCSYIQWHNTFLQTVLSLHFTPKRVSKTLHLKAYIGNLLEAKKKEKEKEYNDFIKSAGFIAMMKDLSVKNK